jgi:hypothetical protein
LELLSPFASDSRTLSLTIELDHPLLFTEKQPTLVVVDHRRLAPLLNIAQHAGNLLNGYGLDVEECLDGGDHLRELVWHDLQHVAHHLCIGNVVTEESQFNGEPGDAVREILFILYLLPHQGFKFMPDLLHIGLIHMLDSDANPLDRLPRHC